MTALWLLLRGDTLGRTVYNVLAALAVLAVLAFLAFSGFQSWRIGNLKDRAESAEANAAAQTKAADDNAGAALNATATRAAVDNAILQIRVTTEQAAARAAANESNAPGDDGSPSADLLRELEEARTRATSAADRLQRTRPR